MDLSIHMQVCTYNCIDFASMHANKHYIVTSCYFLDCHIPIFALVRTSLVSALVNSCMPSLEEKQKDTKELQQQVPLEQWRVGDRSAWADPHCGSSHPVPRGSRRKHAVIKVAKDGKSDVSHHAVILQIRFCPPRQVELQTPMPRVGFLVRGRWLGPSFRAVNERTKAA